MVSLFAVTAVLLSIANIFKVLRWKQFVKIYEKPDMPNLFRALAIGYFVSSCLPFRILGDVARAFISARKMKNGLPYSVATICVDRVLDFIAVTFMFVVMSFANPADDDIILTTLFYVVIVAVIFIALTVFTKFSKYPKKAMQAICSIFNKRIELTGLLFFWSLISSFKALLTRISRPKMTLYTIAMWTAYASSYFFFTKLVNADVFHSRAEVGFNDVFISLFSGRSLIMPTVLQSFGIPFAAVSLCGLVVLVIVSFFIKRVKPDEQIGNTNLLPHISDTQRLEFLRIYFTGDEREFISNYLELNNDVSVICDCSSGSNAVTLLCTDNKSTFFRKYAFGPDADKLYDQKLWLDRYRNILPVAEVVNEKRAAAYYLYDMPYNPNGIGLFEYVHQSDKGFNVIKQVLKTLDRTLHANLKGAIEKKRVFDYIDSKVIGNVKKLYASDHLKPLLAHNTILINGREYKNLGHFSERLSVEYLAPIFENDKTAKIHGDLTIENIVVLDENNWYIIDPNTINPFDSPNLDFGKLLQSLHGGYEFLMRTDKVEKNGNQILFEDIYTVVYEKLLSEYKIWLSEQFDNTVVKSIFWHEVVHWLRLMPYKIEKNGERVLLFYAGLIKVLNDVELMEENVFNEK
jgi:hypothetical protein